MKQFSMKVGNERLEMLYEHSQHLRPITGSWAVM